LKIQENVYDSLEPDIGSKIVSKIRYCLPIAMFLRQDNYQ